MNSLTTNVAVAAGPMSAGVGRKTAAEASPRTLGLGKLAVLPNELLVACVLPHAALEAGGLDTFSRVSSPAAELAFEAAQVILFGQSLWLRNRAKQAAVLRGQALPPSAPPYEDAQEQEAKLFLTRLGNSSASEQAQRLMARGKSLFLQGKHVAAEASCRQLLALRPNDVQALLLLGWTLYYQHRYSEAETIHRRAIALSSGCVEAHCGLGWSLNEQNRYTEAEASCRQSLTLRANNPRAHFGLGRALSSQHRYVAAEASYRQALAVNPNYSEAQAGLDATVQAQGRARPQIIRFVDALWDDLPIALGNLLCDFIETAALTL